MSAAPRIPDVARESGVSPTTVSRVLGGRGRVSEASARKVWAAVEALGYSRSTLLTRSEAVFVGLCAPERPETWQLDTLYLLRRHVLASGWFPVTTIASAGAGRPDGEPAGATEGIFAASAAGAADAGFSAVIHPGFGAVPAAPGVPFLGLSASAGPDRGGADAGVRARGAGPAGVVDGPAEARPSAGRAGRFVELEAGAGMRGALEHLRFLGHRRIGFVEGGDPGLGAALREGFRRFHPAALVTPDLGRWMLRESPTPEGGRRAARTLLDGTCTAMICQSPAAALGVLAEIGEHRLAVPRDISVVAVGDGIESQFSAPPLTALRLDPTAVAAALADLLGDALGSGALPPGRPGGASLPMDLVVRASTGPVRAGR